MQVIKPVYFSFIGNPFISKLFLHNRHLAKVTGITPVFDWLRFA